ncbi:hypothetical protein GE21DRAFT_1267465 [Neurospora crassa]|nr:hypothetical protein B23L21.40 [imported] - Neurospora crassa [Neurospora crassa]KHE78964.1 hypothetical protein GE21DRAFT_1267465 [Neurospora crassa]
MVMMIKGDNAPTSWGYGTGASRYLTRELWLDGCARVEEGQCRIEQGKQAEVSGSVAGVQVGGWKGSAVPAQYRRHDAQDWRSILGWWRRRRETSMGGSGGVSKRGRGRGVNGADGGKRTEAEEATIARAEVDNGSWVVEATLWELCPEWGSCPGSSLIRYKVRSLCKPFRVLGSCGL